MYCIFTLRKIIWISGSDLNSSLTWIEINGLGLTSIVGEIHPIDISVDPVTSKLILLTADKSIYHYDFNQFQQIHHFENHIPVAIDIFEVSAYVVLNSGIITHVCTGGDFCQGI